MSITSRPFLVCKSVYYKQKEFRKWYRCSTFVIKEIYILIPENKEVEDYEKNFSFSGHCA